MYAPKTYKKSVSPHYNFCKFMLFWLLSSCRAQASHCSGFSCCRVDSRVLRLQQLQCMGSVVTIPTLQSTGSVVVVHGLSCSMACEIFPDQGSYLCLLHWQADSPLLSPRGSLLLLFKAILKLENKNCIFNKIHCLEPTTNIILDSDMLEDFLFGNTQASLLSLLALFQKF